MSTDAQVFDVETGELAAVENTTPDYLPPCLDNVKASPQLLGISPLLNPFCDHTSSQRLTMWSNHLTQCQVLRGAEMPRVFSGFEEMVGRYEYSPSHRDHDVQVLAVIPRIGYGHDIDAKQTPYHTVVYRDCVTNLVGYCTLERKTARSDGFGYTNRKVGSWEALRSKNAIISKDELFYTSPAHLGHKYMMGTNLKTAYISDPRVTEDAFVVTESAAKKLATESFTTIAFRIAPNQFPVNCYGDVDHYQFLPEIGETVRPDGVLCALRTPTADSFIYDLYPENRSRVQHLHDSVFYAPPGAEVVNIDVVINRSCKVKTPPEIFAQAEKYRAAINDYDRKVWATYLEVTREGLQLEPAYNTLVTRCGGELLVDGQPLDGCDCRSNTVTPVHHKSTIEFMYFRVTLRSISPMSRGKKLAGRYGNKGTVSAIIPDEEAPVDQYGNRAEILLDPISVFNRMNPSQWMEQFCNATAEVVRRRISTMVSDSERYEEAFNYALEFAADINCNYADFISKQHPDPVSRRHFVDEIIRDGFYLWVPPFIKDHDQKWVARLMEKYQVDKTPVTFTVTRDDGTKTTVTTKKPILIADEYWYLLYKVPHMRSSGVSYVNQFHTPVRPSSLTKLQWPISQVPLRLGEDEFRNILMAAGPEVAAYIIGAYANSPDAIENMIKHLYYDEHPSQLEHLDLSLPEIIQSNAIVGVTKHMFSCIGIDVAPDAKTVADIVARTHAVITDDEDQADDEAGATDR